MINYEQAIKGRYKNAWVRVSFDDFYFLYNGTELVCKGELPTSTSDAWQSAYEKLKKEGKI
jgi:hypothetical protein